MTALKTVRPPLLRILLLLAFALIPCGAALAAPGDAATLRKLAEQDSSLEPARRAELLASLDAADAADAATRETTEEAARLRAEAGTASADARGLERELSLDGSADHSRELREIDALTELDALEELLQQLYARMEPMRRDLQGHAAALSALGAQTAVASSVRLQESISALELEMAGTSSEASLGARVLRTRTESELALRRAELDLAQVQQETAGVRRGVLELRQRLLRQQLAELDELVSRAQSKLGERSETELALLIESLEQQRIAATDAPAALLAQAERNVLLGNEYIEANQQLGALRVETAELARTRERLEQSLRDTESRLALGAVGEAVGSMLLRERQRLPVPQVLQRRVQALRTQGVEIRLRLFDLGDELSQIDARRHALHAELVDGEDNETAHLQFAQSIDPLMQTRTDLLRRLDTTLRRLTERIEQAEVNVDRQLADSLQLKALLDRQLFWIPSHRSVDLGWLGAQAAGWGDLLKPDRITTALSLTASRIGDQLLLSLTVIALLALLYVAQRRAARALPTLAPQLRRIHQDRYLLTWQALGWTLIAALPWAGITWTAGLLLQSAGEPGKYTHSLGTALAALAGSVGLFTFLRWLVIDKGLAHCHFRWTRARREALARAIPPAAAVLLPAQFLSTLALIRGQDLAIDTAGRSLLMLFAVVGGGLLWWLLAPGRLWSPRGGVHEPVRLRQALRIGLLALLLLVMLLTLRGYVFTAGVLVRCLWQTGGVMLLVAILYGLLGRWFLLGERRLALRRAEARREAALEAGEDASDGELPPEAEAEQLDIQSIGAQTQRLVRAVAATAMVLLLFWVWADILPALQRLDEIALWSFSDKASDGSAIIGFVSLRAALLGVALLVLTVVAARNLPGLIEIGLLSRISIDAPSRYAITSVARYAIVIVGVLFGLSFLGMRWSQLQWMAAALTVGLGFGLQEIFANFVSGLILLFERPFRVGDIITIGEFTGRVTRIRTRATTILDFDNKEVVIPNKAFITDRLTNWTLSDTMTRVIIKVGVAYGSDAALVHRLLLQAAGECSYVARDPGPHSWFLAFGTSSFDFELRVFVPSIDQRLLAQSDLHDRISRLFTEHDIAIAFPQMDLHVRELPLAAISPAAPKPGTEGGAPVPSSSSGQQGATGR
jgi:potassium efflux system protein